MRRLLVASIRSTPEPFSQPRLSTIIQRFVGLESEAEMVTCLQCAT